jgi:hypothetical protein
VHIISFNTHECSTTTTAMAVPQGKTATNYTHKPPPTCNIATRCTSRTCHSPLQSSCRLEKLYVLVQQLTIIAALVRGHLFKAAARCCTCQRNAGFYRQSHCFPRFCLQSMAPLEWVNQLPLAVSISPVSGPAARMLSLTSAAAGVNMDGDASMPATCRFSSAARRSSRRCTMASCWASLGALLGLGKAGPGAPKPGGSRHGRSTCAARLPIELQSASRCVEHEGTACTSVLEIAANRSNIHWQYVWPDGLRSKQLILKQKIEQKHRNAVAPAPGQLASV